MFMEKNYEKNIPIEKIDFLRKESLLFFDNQIPYFVIRDDVLIVVQWIY